MSIYYIIIWYEFRDKQVERKNSLLVPHAKNDDNKQRAKQILAKTNVILSIIQLLELTHRFSLKVIPHAG